uniref:Mitochondrial import receptor subunit TOM22 homolog n=1 Tax=Zonotrichia albicollis TaxID=44394 RepID=A0A8D2MH85_ZONAL
MAAAASLSPEELLPKGGAGKAEELEDELDEEEEDDEELDETLAERLWGLTEMFPESVRSAAGATFDLSLTVAQKMYRFSRAALWIGTTSFMILVLPVVFETEKLQMEQQQQLQQRQVRQEGSAVCPGPAELAGSACTSRWEQCWGCWGRRVRSVVCCGLTHPTRFPDWVFSLDNPADSQWWQCLASQTWLLLAKICCEGLQ